MCTQNLLRHEVKKGNVRGAGVQAIPLLYSLKHNEASLARHRKQSEVEFRGSPFLQLSLLFRSSLHSISTCWQVQFQLVLTGSVLQFSQKWGSAQSPSVNTSSKSEPRELNHISEQSLLICRECYCKRWWNVRLWFPIPVLGELREWGMFL